MVHKGQNGVQTCLQNSKTAFWFCEFGVQCKCLEVGAVRRVLKEILDARSSPRPVGTLTAAWSRTKNGMRPETSGAEENCPSMGVLCSWIQTEARIRAQCNEREGMSSVTK